MKKSLLFLLIILAFSAILLIGFISKPFAEEEPRVVVVLKDQNTQYWEIVKVGAEKGFRDFGIDGEVIAPSFSSKEDQQVHILEHVLKEKPDALVVSPFESSVIITKLQQFGENNIPVLLIDTDVPLGNKAAYIGTNNFELGRKAGELLASQLQPGDEVALIAADLTSPVIGERIKGAKFSLEAAGIKIAAEKAELQTEPLAVRKAMRMTLQHHPDIKGIFATTDRMALSALEVIEEQGYKIPVIGADGIIKMVESIEEGTLTATVAQNPYDMGYISVETALKAIKGEKAEKEIDTGVDIIIKENAKQRLDSLKNLLK